MYEAEVQNPGGFLGGNVLIKCNIPTFVKEYVRVTSWLQEPAFNIFPALTSGIYRIHTYESASKVIGIRNAICLFYICCRREIPYAAHW